MAEDPQEPQEENDEFFELVDEDDVIEEPVDSRTRWLTVGIIAIAIIVTIFLGVTGIRSLNAASDDAGYEDRTWVMTGTFVDLTPDLLTKANVAKYSGSLPADRSLNGAIFKSDLADARSVSSGSTVEFRGSQTGQSKGDFPQTVDALLARTGDNQVEVVRTGKAGSLHQITADSVRNATVGGWAALIGAFVVFAAGIVAAVWVNRRLNHGYEDIYEEENLSAE